MFESLKLATFPRRFKLNRKAMVLAGTVVGGYIAMSIIDKVSDEPEDLVIVVEEETTVEAE